MNIPIQNPIFRIITAFLFIILLFAIAIVTHGLINDGNPLVGFSVILLVPLAMFVGPYMGATYPNFGYTYLIGLIIVLAIAIVGFKYRNNIWGQVAAVIGIVGWLFMGMLGLGTGT